MPRTTTQLVTTTASSSTAATVPTTGQGSTASLTTLVHEVNHSGPDSVGVLSISGTFTSALPVVEVIMDGGSVWLPAILIDQKTLTSSAAPAPSNSTTTSYRFSCAGAKYIRSFCTGGTLTATRLEITSGTSTEFGNDRAVLNNSVSALQTFAAGFTLPDSAAATFGTGSDITILWDGTDLLVAQALADSSIKWGVSGAGINHVFYGDTATRDMTWDQTNDQLLFNDNAKLAVGTGAGAAGDITFSWNASKMLVGQLTTNSAIDWGVDDDGIDQNWYGATASALMQWDQSADSLIFTGVAGVQGFRAKSAGAVAITTTRAMTLADSGGIFTVSQASAYDIDLPSPTSGPGCTYVFSLTAAGANNVTITVAGSAATFVGTIVNDVTSVIVATGSTLTFATGASALGDTIIVRSIATNLYHVQAVTSTAGGITVS